MQDAPHPTLSHTSHTPGASDLLSQPDVAELYVQLLCSFDPGSVLPFLQSRERYDVRRCMAYCAEAGDRCAAARAFLHERLGELEAAGRLYIAEAVRWVWGVWVDAGDKSAAASTNGLANLKRRGGCTLQKP